MTTTITTQTNVFDIAQQRGVTLLNECDAQLQQEQFLLVRESRTQMVVQAYSDSRVFLIYPGWFRVIKDGVVEQTNIISTWFRYDGIPRFVLLLTQVLAHQFWATQRSERPTNRAAMLRWIAACQSSAGWHRPPEGWHLFAGGGSRYHQCPFAWESWIDQATWDRLVAFTDRYQRLYHHLTEIAPQWVETRKDFSADNSVEVTEVSRTTGAVRTRMIVAPGGDGCF